MSQSWTSGYVADIAYIEGFYIQQSPARMALACLSGNVAVDLPEPEDTACYLELGCGCGIGGAMRAVFCTGSGEGRDHAMRNQIEEIRERERPCPLIGHDRIGIASRQDADRPRQTDEAHRHTRRRRSGSGLHFRDFRAGV